VRAISPPFAVRRCVDNDSDELNTANTTSYTVRRNTRRPPTRCLCPRLFRRLLLSLTPIRVAEVNRSSSFICLFVRTIEHKRLKLQSRNLPQLGQSIMCTGYPFNIRSKGERSRLSSHSIECSQRVSCWFLYRSAKTSSWQLLNTPLLRKTEFSFAVNSCLHVPEKNCWILSDRLNEQAKQRWFHLFLFHPVDATHVPVRLATLAGQRWNFVNLCITVSNRHRLFQVRGWQDKKPPEITTLGCFIPLG